MVDFVIGEQQCILWLNFYEKYVVRMGYILVCIVVLLNSFYDINIAPYPNNNPFVFFRWKALEEPNCFVY